MGLFDTLTEPFHREPAETHPYRCITLLSENCQEEELKAAWDEWRDKPDAPQTPEALEVVSRHYTQRFGHPPFERGMVDGTFRQLDMEQSLQLMREALRTGEPVPGWAEVYERIKIHAELERVGTLYMERFGHPPYHRGLVDGISRPLRQDQSLQLIQDALERNEPVPGWAEAYESNKVSWASKGAIT